MVPLHAHASVRQQCKNGISSHRVRVCARAREYVFTQTGCSHVTLTDGVTVYTVGTFFFSFVHTHIAHILFRDTLYTSKKTNRNPINKHPLTDEMRPLLHAFTSDC